MVLTDFETAICQCDSKLITQKLTENELAGIATSLEIIHHYGRPGIGYIWALTNMNQEEHIKLKNSESQGCY